MALKLNIIGLSFLFLFWGCDNPAQKTNQQNIHSVDSLNRFVSENVITSDSLPKIEIKVHEAFTFLGKFDFEIIASSDEYEKKILGKPIAAGERLVFVNADDDKQVNKLFVVQLEGFLPLYDFTYNYDFSNAEFIGENRYRHNTWFYNSGQLAQENPKGEGAKTRKFLEDKGFRLEDEFMMSRFVGLASEDRKNEIIIYYIEMLRKNTGYTLKEIEDTINKEEATIIRNELIERSKKSFTIIKG